MGRNRVDRENGPVAEALTDERRDLTLEQAADAVGPVDGPDAVERAGVQPGRHIGLRLEAWSSGAAKAGCE